MNDTIETEQKLLSETDIKATISPVLDAGGIALSIVSSVFLRGLAAAIPRHFAYKAISNRAGRQIFTTLSDENVEPGEIVDIVDKVVKMREVTLTERSLYLLYEKGIFSKEKRCITLPNEFVAGVNVVGMIGKRLLVNYRIKPEDNEKPFQFNLTMHPADPEKWVETMRKLPGVEEKREVMT